MARIAGWQIWKLGREARDAGLPTQSSGRTVDLEIWVGIMLRIVRVVLVTVVLLAGLLGQGGAAIASLQDDNFDGNIFALYAGNGSLVPPKVLLESSLQQHKPALVLFYVDDSRDCKRFSVVYSQLQAGYGRAADFIPINADTVVPGVDYPVTDARHYYQGVVPQLTIFDQKGKVVLDGQGQLAFEAIDDRLRKVFDLLPRTESQTLKRRQFNEVNSELIQRP